MWYNNNMKSISKLVIILMVILFVGFSSYYLIKNDIVVINKKNVENENINIYEMDDGSRYKIDGELASSLPDIEEEKSKSRKIATESIVDKCVILPIELSGDEMYYKNSRINDGFARLYVVPDGENKKNKTVTINAGHGVVEGFNEKVYCHPDMSERAEIETASEPIYMTYAITDGMMFDDGRAEDSEVLKIALYARDILLENGYNVLMIREDGDSRLDNIARAILANNHSDIHISLHFDSTRSNKGMFTVVPIKKKSYIEMEPIKNNYDGIINLANNMIEAWKEDGLKVFQNGMRGEDLVQISYSTVPSIDIEMGDKETPLPIDVKEKMAMAIYHGVDKYFESIKEDEIDIIYEEENEE